MMHTTNLRKVGGSVMLTVPPALLNILNLRPGSRVDVAVRSGRLIVKPQLSPRYTLDELLAKCDPSAPSCEDDRVWLADNPVGGELI